MIVTWFCAGSVMSLASGLTFGALIAYGGYRTSVNPRDFVFLFGKSTVGKQE